MTKTEIKGKLDEIVEFAGISKYIDTPVKRYSSGMYVRLAFAVAAHLEPEILIVDEVLAVGDADFQKKALGKMKDVSRTDGRTVLFVSHNMESILRLCERCILLENAKLTIDDYSDRVINYYLEKNFGTLSQKSWDTLKDNNEVQPLAIHVHNDIFETKDNFLLSEVIGITFDYEILTDVLNVKPGIKFTNQYNINIFDSHENTETNELQKSKGRYSSTVWIPPNFFNEGIILISAALLQPDPFKVFFLEQDSIAFNVFDKGKSITRGEYVGSFPGIIRPSFNWQTKKVNKYERF